MDLLSHCTDWVRHFADNLVKQKFWVLIRPEMPFHKLDWIQSLTQELLLVGQRVEIISHRPDLRLGNMRIVGLFLVQEVVFWQSAENGLLVDLRFLAWLALVDEKLASTDCLGELRL